MSWIEKCELLLNDELNTREMMKVSGLPHEKVKEIRLKINAQQRERGMPLYNPKLVPTELFLREIGKTYNHFEDRAKKEVRLIKLKREVIDKTK